MKAKHFALSELVHPEIYNLLGETAWKLLDPDAPAMLDGIRDRFGPVAINTWNGEAKDWLPKVYRSSGLRPINSRVGSSTSQHKYGGAFDLKFRDYEVDEVWHFITNNPEEFPLIKRVEHIDATPTWLHVDRKPHDHGGIYVFRP